MPCHFSYALVDRHRRQPYMDGNLIYLVVHKGKRPEVPATLSTKDRTRVLVALMRRCWHQEPKKRPSFEAIATQLKPQLPRRSSSSKKKLAQALSAVQALSQSVSELHEKVEDVDAHVQSGVDILRRSLDAAEGRLANEVRTGNAEVLHHMRLLHGSLLPEIQCVLAQQTLEISAMRQRSENSSENVWSWLWPSKEEEERKLHAAQRSVQLAIEAADAKLRASVVGSVAAFRAEDASAEILKKLAAIQASQPTHEESKSDDHGEALLSKLDQLYSYLSQMDDRMMGMRLEMDEQTKDQAKQLNLLHSKLDTLLTGSHEQVFRFFILVPKPHIGYMDRAIDTMKPRHWFAKPMLLIPLYQAESGELKHAPINAANGGFEVSKPFDFVKKHPRAVQLAMLVLKAGIKIGAAQLGVAIPAASTAMLNSVTDLLVTDTLELAIEAMGTQLIAKEEGGPSHASQAMAQISSDDKQQEDSIADFIAKEAATAPPDEVLQRLESSEEYKAASHNEYMLLEAWLNQLHPGWKARCGLEPRVDQETGRVKWQPVGTSSTRVGPKSAMSRAHDWLRRQETSAQRPSESDLKI